MNRHGNLCAGAAIAAATVSSNVVSGAEISIFFAQTGEAADLGILCAGAIFAGIAAGLICVRRVTGARSVPQLAKYFPQSTLAAALIIAHGLLMAASAWMALESAARIGSMLVPSRIGGVLSIILVLLSAILSAFQSEGKQLRICAVVFAAYLLYFAALACFGRLRGAESQYAEVELRLSGSIPAAIALSTIHACLRAGIAANAILYFAESPWTAIPAGAGYALCLFLGAAAVRRQPKFATALRQPLTAIAAGWGKAGFLIPATLTLVAASVTLHAALMSCFSRGNDVKL